MLSAPGNRRHAFVVAHPKVPVTAAMRWLRERGIEFSVHPYRYEERGGTRVSSRELAVPESNVIKTLVMENERTSPLIVLMHGDREVSTKNLARTLGCKTVTPCRPDVAERHTGYRVGGTSPFGTRKPLAVYVERTILVLPTIYINAGQRGLLVQLAPSVLVDQLMATPVDVAV